MTVGNYQREKDTDTGIVQVMPDGIEFLNQILWNNHQTTLQSLVGVLAATSFSPWNWPNKLPGSSKLPMSGHNAVAETDQANVNALRLEILRYYETKWAHQRLINGEAITPWRKDALRCLQGTVHKNRDEGLCQSLYWFYHSDQARERILAAQERDHTLHTAKVDESKTNYQPSVHLVLQALDRNACRHARKWAVEYWWRDQQGQIYLWKIPQNDHGLAMVDNIWHGGEVTLWASTTVVRDWLLGHVSSLRPICLGGVCL